jgi:hypothetical protein
MEQDDRMKTASDPSTLGKRSAAAESQASGEQPKRTNSESGGEKPRKQRPFALRALLWTLRAAIVPILLIAALIGGLYVGYVVLGKAPEDDVWEIETWKHMYDLIFSDS